MVWLNKTQIVECSGCFPLCHQVMSPRAAESTTELAPGPRNWFVSWSNRLRGGFLCWPCVRTSKTTVWESWRTSMTQMYPNVCTCNFHKSPIMQAQLLTLVLHVEAVQFKASLSLPRIKEVAIATLLFRFPLIGHWAPYLNASNVLLRGRVIMWKHVVLVISKSDSTVASQWPERWMLRRVPGFGQCTASDSNYVRRVAELNQGPGPWPPWPPWPLQSVRAFGW